MNLNTEKYRHDLEVVRNTAKQIIKDFGISGLEIIFSGNTHSAYKELLHQITPVLGQLYLHDREAFHGLLYRIDVDENKVKKIIKNSEGDNFERELAELVIEREFIKVLTRKLYSR